MRLSIPKLVALFGGLALGCAAPVSSDSTTVDPAVAKYVLASVPTDVQNPTRVDFGGKVELVGWELTPKDRAAPGASLALKLFWRSSKKLTPGWRLFTHLTGSDGKVYAFDDVGPLRETVSESALGKTPRLPPSTWLPGMVYVDEQTLAIPEEVAAPSLTLSVGFEHEALDPQREDERELEKPRLEVLSGVTDGQEGALIARLVTGVGANDRRPPSNRKRRPGMRPPGERRPGAPPSRGPLGRPQGLDAKENPP